MLEAPVPLAPESTLHLRLVLGGERADVDARVRGCAPRSQGRRPRLGRGRASSRTSIPPRASDSSAPCCPGGRAGPRDAASGPASSRTGGSGQAAGPLERVLPGVPHPRRRVGLSHVRGGRRPEPGAGAGVAGQAQDRPGQLARLVRHVHADDGVPRQVGLVLEVGHDGRAALREHAQERRRGLARGGVAQVGHDVRRLDVGGEIRERHAAGHDREVARAEPLEVGLEPAGVRHRARRAAAEPGGPAPPPAPPRGPRSRPASRGSAARTRPRRPRRRPTPGAPAARARPTGRPAWPRRASGRTSPRSRAPPRGPPRP